MAYVAYIRQLIRPTHVNKVELCRRFCSNVIEGENAEDKERQKEIDPAKDRTKVIPVETSMRYLQSSAYKECYGNTPVWVKYRRNHKGQLPPRKTREKCVRKGMISTGNPCPICRDEYLILDARNVELLEQFISEHTGQVFSYSKTGLCQKKHKELLVAIERARDQGYLTFDVPFREYDYSEYGVSTKSNVM